MPSKTPFNHPAKLIMTSTVLHLRSETKHLERRSPLTPTTAKALLEAGYKIYVERSPGRIFDDEEFEAVGVTLVPKGSWVDAPADTIILGLKELPESDSPLHHAHIHFGHCFKGQENWNLYLNRFARGGGTLYDLEFLTDVSGKRVAAFGYHAGYAGAAIAILAWAHQLAHPETPLPAIPNFLSQSAVVDTVTNSLLSSINIHNNGQPPVIIVIGALGRCGSGAVDFCLAAGVPSSCILEWDMAETARGGPYSQIASADIFINCIYSDKAIPPFITYDALSIPGRRLRVACDVSCDPNGPYNPVPIYHEITTFLKPTVPVEVGGSGPKMTMISIDHLPSLVAREASDAFSEQLLPSLKKLNQRYEDGVWLRAEKLFTEKVAELTELPKGIHTFSTSPN